MGILLNTFKKDLFAKKLIKTTAARKWLFDKVKDLRVNRAEMLRQGSVTKVFIGQMFFFFYDPKTKETLPYYDRFPLVIPIEMYDDGFLGLNLHYLDPGLRVMLLDRLMEFASNKNLDEKTKLRLSYDLIANASKLAMAKPCIKRYLFSHIQSRFINIAPSEWDIAVFLPAESFVGASKQKVWKESKEAF
jgi:hypothetical protein